MYKVGRIANHAAIIALMAFIIAIPFGIQALSTGFSDDWKVFRAFWFTSSFLAGIAILLSLAAIVADHEKSEVGE